MSIPPSPNEAPSLELFPGRTCTECAKPITSTRAKTCSTECGRERTKRFAREKATPEKSPAVRALLVDAEPGHCMACDKLLPPGHTRLCTAEECGRLYNTLYAMHRRRELRRAAEATAPALVETFEDAKHLEELRVFRETGEWPS